MTYVAPDGTLDVVWHPSTAVDSWHANCVAVVDGQVWVTAFGRFDTGRGWVGDVSLGAGFLRNLTTGQEIRTRRGGPAVRGRCATPWRGPW